MSGHGKKAIVDETWVLDSFAVLALLGGELGGEGVARLLQQAQKKCTC